MKKSLVVALVLLASTTFAQEKSKTYRAKLNEKKVMFRIENANVSIQGYDGNELIIEGEGIQPLPKEAEGLKAVGGGGTDNTGLNLAIRTEGDMLIVATSIRQDEVNYMIKVPKQTSLIWKAAGTAFETPQLSIDNIQGEIEINARPTDILLENISGPVVAYTMGNIKAKFSTVNQSKPISLMCHGSVDVSLPSDTKATISMTATSGNSFTDFDFKPMPKSEQAKEHTEVDGVVVTGKSVSVSGRGTSSVATVAGKPASAPTPAQKAQSAAVAAQQAKADASIRRSQDGATIYGSGSETAISYSVPSSTKGSIEAPGVFLSFNGTSDESPNSTKGFINAPGVSIKLRSYGENIYLRKNK